MLQPGYLCFAGAVFYVGKAFLQPTIQRGPVLLAHVANSGFVEETQQEELVSLVGQGPAAHPPCPAEAGALALPHSQALDGHTGLFCREDCMTSAK